MSNVLSDKKMQPYRKRKMLGEMLVEEGLLSNYQLARALAEQKAHGGRMGKILNSLGYVTEEGIIQVLGKQIGIAYKDIASLVVEPEIIRLVTETMARRHQILPVNREDNILTLAMVDPLDVFAIDDVTRATGCEIAPVISKATSMLEAIDRNYSELSSMEEAVRETGGEEAILDEGSTALELTKLSEDAPVVKLSNTIISQAVKEGASDIHIEPQGDNIRIRYRCDGILRDVMSVPRNLQAGLTSRIKIISGLDISERRVPQDGRLHTKITDKEIDIRISTLPTIFGEKIVMRLLDKAKLQLSLSDLGFAPEMLQRFERIVNRPHGLILATGPTGSGKTTTLYAALKKLASVEKNIITIEDPVEYQIRSINQMQVNPKIGLTFATGLRSILRQDPDIVMVGEIRDRETASIAIQASLTGHLVLSTLHTNDSIGAITRLIDMGIEPFLVSSALVGVVAQRLIRKVCSRCRKSFPATQAMIEDLSLTQMLGGGVGLQFIRGAGCQECRGSGYIGRVGIYELLVIDEVVRHLIANRSSAAEISRKAEGGKFRSLRDDGVMKAVQSVTSVEEVLRVTQATE